MTTDTTTDTVTLEITAKIADIQNRLPAMYRDFTRNYDALASHPENTEYQHAVAAIQDNLRSEENSLRDMLAGHRGAYNASKTRVGDYNTLYTQNMNYIILIAIGIIVMIQFIFSAKSYRLAAPTLGGALAGFVVYVVVLIIYVRTYGTSGWVFVVLLLPLIIYAFAIFVQKTCAPGAAAAAAAVIK